MRITPWLVAAVFFFAIWRLYSHRDVDHGPGAVAVAVPAQQLLDGEAAIERGAFRLRPRAQFSATVRVLRREDYSLDRISPLVPTDFAVGWGPMSDSRVLADIEISQGNRFYFWRTEDWPIDRGDIESNSANWHVIPENAAVGRVLDRLRTGSIVELSGRLVDIEAGDGGMKTSLSRTDTGAGACEILLASSARELETGR
ncbi:MAG: hypothetical protein H7Y89_05960 [Steroidobacteraceae bacterium]|nr:hypothetical protein [Steroidobacteraceae bacterium]